LNLCNLAPIVASRSVTMIHDAQVFITPESYSTAFRRWYQFALPRIGRRSEFIVTVSQYSKDAIAKYGIADPQDVRVLPNGVDHVGRALADETILKRLSLTPGRYVVALANTQVHKNIRLLFEVFRRPCFRHVTLALYGGATAHDFTEAGWPPPANVCFAGKLSDGELRALLEQAAAMAFPSTTEGFGLPPVEAMYLGCPAVVAPAGGLPEACGAGAIYADVQDPDAWADRLLTLVEDPVAREAAALRGREHARERTWARSSSQLLTWLTAAAASAD
jgi:glycosyltransferase involved in cell wall biosynthesis